MKCDRYENCMELAVALQEIGGRTRLFDAAGVEYLIPLKCLAAVTPDDAFLFAARDGTRWPLVSLAYPVRVGVPNLSKERRWPSGSLPSFRCNIDGLPSPASVFVAGN